MADFQEKVNELLLKIPQSQRQAAASLLAQYGPRFFDMVQEDIWQYLRRLMAGDLEAVAELDAMLSDDEFVSKVKTNTARWTNVAQYNVVRNNLRNELLLRLAPIVLSLLAATVGLL